MGSSILKIPTYCLLLISALGAANATGEEPGFRSAAGSMNNAIAENLQYYSHIFNTGIYNFSSLLIYQDARENLDDDTRMLFETDTSGLEKPPLFKQQEIQREPFVNDEYGLDVPLPEGYEVSREIDSAGTMLFSREALKNIDMGYEYELGIDDYLRLRKENIQSQVWDSLVKEYDLTKALSGGDLARMLSAATGFTIPIPPNPVMGIFGKPEIGINVNGEVNIRIGWRWDSQNLGTVSAFGQTQSTPIFNQDIRVNVSGRIGDKLKLSTDWNTRSTFDQDNKFKIGYEGYDDDIIKLVEVGNVSLPLTSTLIGGGQALFGVRTDFQFGPLFLKTLFSQRRGQRKFVDVRGGVSKQYFQIRAYDYAKNHFFIDTAYFEIYKDYFKNSTPILPNTPGSRFNRVKQIEVWESSNNVQEVIVGRSVAIADLEGKRLRQGEFYDPAIKNITAKAGEVVRGNFSRLDSTKYEFDHNLGTLSIKNLKQDRYYAVSYRIDGSSTDPVDDIYIGTLTETGKAQDTLILKLVYHPNMQPGFRSIWKRQMKNIYQINATNVNVDETDISIWYIRQSNDSVDVLEGAPDKLVTIMGVDQVNNATGQTPPDGKFDLRHPFFDTRTGEITFPSPEPFRDGLREYFDEAGNPALAEQYVFNEVYDTTYDVARLNTARDRFVISGEVSGRATNRIALGAFNLQPGSVRVTLDGVQLREYQDYVVDYYAGTLTLRNQRATLPNANLKIEYEQQDIFNISTRTLAGVRADYQLLKSRHVNSGLGMTLMHYDQSAIIDRVRLGEEPVSNTMLGFDAKLQWDTPWLTRALDALPFYDTKTPSSMDINGEWAMILPTPNKRASDVTSDNGEPVVYIDDFEGAQRYIPLGLNPSQWQHSSQPVDSSIADSDFERANFRGKLFWYQYFIPRVSRREVYPNEQTYSGNTNLSPLEIDFSPYERGIYSRNTSLPDSTNPAFNPDTVSNFLFNNKQRMWGGFQRLFSSFNTNFDTENIEYIEVMMRINEWNPGETKMFIEVGQISEDIIPGNELNTEDGITDANPLPNNIIDGGEDLGIDARSNAAEQDEYPSPLNLEDDPAKDDYAFDFGKDDRDRTREDFNKYNNFEGNALVSEVGQFPDTEILNANNGQNISTDNSYFQYEVELLPDPNINDQIIGGNEDARWFLYRIPIRKPKGRVGNPLFSNIQYIRVWFKGGSFKAQVADWRLAGSQWQRISNFQSNVPENDSVLQIAFVNVFENAGAPDFYTMPPGVRAPRQLNNPDPNLDIRLNEQSLSVCVNNLRYGDERMAVRIFRPLDLFFYKNLKFFFHGDGSQPDQIVPGAIPKAYAFVRFGTDSSNYYEYRRPLTRGWQDIDINLNELTAIKQIRDTSNYFERQTFPVQNDPLAFFAVRGNPVLTRVQFFGIGIANPEERFPNELTTCMWVDELRLISPEDGADWAGVANANIKLADLGSVNATFSNQQPNFHRLEDRFGNRSSNTNWSFNVQGNLEKFAPTNFNQLKLPISYTHAEYMTNPEFVANNDINLEQAAEAARFNAYNNAKQQGLSDEEADQLANSAARSTSVRSQTLRVQDSWALTGVKLGIPIDYWLINDTFNKLTLGYSYSQEFERSPVYEQRFNWQWRMSAQYTTNLPTFLQFSPFVWAADVPILGTYDKLKINPIPSNFSAGVDMMRRRQTEKSRFLDFPSPVLRDFSALRSAQFSWKLSEGGFINPLIDYQVSTNSSLVKYELDEFGRQRTGSELGRQVLFNDGFINFGDNTMHTQNVTINFKPRLPNIGGITNYIDMTGSYTTSYTWQNPLQQDPTIRDLAKNAGYNSQLRFNMPFRLKALADKWFGISDSRGRGRPAFPGAEKDTTEEDTGPRLGLFGTIGRVFKTIFLDYDKLEFIFQQQNTSTNPGVLGGNGFDNFWSRGLLGRNSFDYFGPSFAYQMGLVTNPHGGFNIGGSNSFPFFKFDSYDGLRPPNGVMQDNFNQTTSFEIRTTRPLWEDATLDLTWKTDLGFNRNQTVVTDENGIPDFQNIIALESFNRTYLSFPSFFGLNVFNNTVENVVGLYRQREQQILNNPALDTVQKNQALQNALAESFYEGLEAFSFASGSAGKFLPAVNWGIRWEGLEDWGIWGGYAKRVSLEHKYQSTYQENVQITDNGRAVQNQIVQFGFQPIIGITAAFDEEKLDGNLTGTLRWSTTKSFQLNSAARSTISAQATTEITGQASYVMRGFSFSLLGLELENDFELSMLATYKDNDRTTFDVFDEQSFQNNEEGRTLDGNTQIILEPRARYSMSQRVTASFFVRYEGTFTEGAAQPGYHTTQVGLDIRISIAGGR